MPDLDETLYDLERHLTLNPHDLAYAKRWFKRIEVSAKSSALVFRLMEKPGWCNFNQSLLLELRTELSMPFVKLCIALADRKYRYDAGSLHRFWRRCIATGESHVITYFSWNFLDKTVTSDDIITGGILLEVCCQTKNMLDNAKAMLTSDRSVDVQVRVALGGLSLTSDVKAAWKKWCLTHHPDKGGDPEVFLNTKIIYDEWLALQPKEHNG